MGGRARVRAVLVAGLAIVVLGTPGAVATAPSGAEDCAAALVALPVEDVTLPAGYAWERLHPGWTGSIAAIDAPGDEARILTVTLTCDPDADHTFQRAAEVRAVLGLEQFVPTALVGEESVGLRWTEGSLTGLRIDWREGPFVGSVANRHPTAGGEVVPITVLAELAGSLEALFRSAMDPAPSPTPDPSGAGGSLGPQAPSPAPTPAGPVESPVASPGPSAGVARVIDLELDAALQILQDGRQVDVLTVTPGETIAFRLTNTAGYAHSFWIGTDDQLRVSQTHRLPGIPDWDDPEPRTLTWVVPEDPATLRFGCTIPGHYSLMNGRFRVAGPRAERAPQARLTMSRNRFRLADLPAMVTVRFAVRDADGHPFDGAPVVFSLSVPGQPTVIMDAVLVDGVARWVDVPIAREGAERGAGFVTARADLGPAFDAAAATLPFVIR